MGIPHICDLEKRRKKEEGESLYQETKSLPGGFGINS